MNIASFDIFLFFEASQKWLIVWTFGCFIEIGRNVEYDKDGLFENALSNGDRFGKFVHFERV